MVVQKPPHPFISPFKRHRSQKFEDRKLEWTVQAHLLEGRPAHTALEGMDLSKVKQDRIIRKAINEFGEALSSVLGPNYAGVRELSYYGVTDKDGIMHLPYLRFFQRTRSEALDRPLKILKKHLLEMRKKMESGAYPAGTWPLKEYKRIL
ncbi:MAG: hypothetical protein JW834_02610 [Candidatus Diapherotrites archaeon]|nr:hypothetical protein [Candidatus Diapherotrites archaeon]